MPTSRTTGPACRTGSIRRNWRYCYLVVIVCVFRVVRPLTHDLFYVCQVYLSDEDFGVVFQMSRQEFNALKPWRKNQFKKAAGLF